MKKFIYILFTLLIITNKMMAEELFPNILYSNCSSSIEKIVINEFTNIDSLVKEYNKKIPKLDVTLSFYNTDTETIDSTISLLKVHRLILDISFHNCTFKILPYSIRKLSSLTGLHFNSCDSLVSLNGFNTTNTLFLITLESCRIKELPEGLDKIYSFLFLMLDFPNDFTGFDLNKELEKFSDRKNILNLFVKYKLLDKFPESLFKLTNLQSLMFFTDSSVYFPPRFDELKNLLEIWTSSCNNKLFTRIDAPRILTSSTFCDYTFFDEEYSKNDDFIAEYKNSLCEYSRVIHLLVDNYQSVINPDFSFYYEKDGMYFNSMMKFNLNENEIIFHIDTIQHNIKFEIKNLKESDSVKVYISKHKTDIPIYSYDYKKEGIIIDFKELKEIFYFLIIRINERQLVLELQIADNKKKKK